MKNSISLCILLPIVLLASSVHAEEPIEPVVEHFVRFCLSDATTLDDRVALIDRTPGWRRLPISEKSGFLHKADKKYAWKGEISGASYDILLSKRSKSKDWSTSCEIQALPTQDVSAYVTDFSREMLKLNLKPDEQLPPYYFQFSGRLPNGRRAHSRISSGVVYRGVNQLTSPYMSLNIIY